MIGRLLLSNLLTVTVRKMPMYPINDEMKGEIIMKSICINCQKEVDEWYRVNERGTVFCGDDCYESYLEHNDVNWNDSSHPYIDDYELIRSDYLEWLETWEYDILSVPKRKYVQKIDEMIDSIDEVFDVYWDYYRTGGDDGVFAREIYRYLLKFENLQKSTLQWRPKREVFFYLSFTGYDEDARIEIATWTELSELLKVKKANTLFKILKEHVHTSNKLRFLFNSKEEFDGVVKKLKRKFKNNVVNIQHEWAYLCDGDCSKTKIITESQAINQNGWYFCECCDQSLFPGFFSKEKLVEEIKFYDVWRNLKKQSKMPSWPFYLRKIKRSCRFHGIGYPDWIELNYDI
jgi:hypothetical protein